MASLHVKDAENEKESGGKGVGKNSGLKNSAYYNENTYHHADKTGAFGLAEAEEEHADRDPHYAYQNKQS
jgi:hypothetical protein